MSVSKAEASDYLKIQQGMPTVKVENGLTVIHHDYPAGKGMIVKSHKSVKEYGEIDLEVEGAMKRFKIALLRVFHGEPCEAASREAGGDGYDRK